MDTTFILASPDRSLPGILAFRVYPQDPNTHLLALDVEVNGNAVGKFTLNYTTTAFRTIHTLIAKDILRDQENHILFSVSGWGSVSIDDPVLWYQLT